MALTDDDVCLSKCFLSECLITIRRGFSCRKGRVFLPSQWRQVPWSWWAWSDLHGEELLKRGAEQPSRTEPRTSTLRGVSLACNKPRSLSTAHWGLLITFCYIKHYYFLYLAGGFYESSESSGTAIASLQHKVWAGSVTVVACALLADTSCENGAHLAKALGWRDEYPSGCAMCCWALLHVPPHFWCGMDSSLKISAKL